MRDLLAELARRMRLHSTVRHAQYELAHRDERDDVISEICCEAGHALAATARAEAAPFTAQADDPFEPAVCAPAAGKASCQYAAGEKSPQLFLHEFGNARAVVGLGSVGKKGLQMLLQDLVQHALLGVAAFVAGAAMSRPLDVVVNGSRRGAREHAQRVCARRAGSASA